LRIRRLRGGAAKEDAMAEVRNRRQSLLIDKKFQSKFIAVGLTTLIALGLGFGILWFASFANQPAAEQVGGHNGSFTLGVVLLLVLILVLVIVTVMYGLRFSHRVVGPIFAFNRHLNWVKEGNYSRDLKLREGDEFVNLAITFNAMQSSLRRRAREDLEIVDRLQKMVAEVGSSVKSERFDPSAIGSVLNEATRELSGVKKRNEGLLAS
jgi:methyl-accepting chemotaxis protein